MKKGRFLMFEWDFTLPASYLYITPYILITRYCGDFGIEINLCEVID